MAAERGPGFAVLEALDSYAARPEGAASDRGAQRRAAFAATALASRPAEAFALEDLESFIVARRFVAKRKASAATCAKDFRYLKAACAYARAKGKIARHYFENLAGDKTTRKRLMPAYKVAESVGKEIPQAHLKAILSRLRKDARRAVLFARTSGCRKAEVAALDWQKHWSPEGFRPIVQKGSKPRVVACDPALVGPRGIGLVFSELGGTRAANLRSPHGLLALRGQGGEGRPLPLPRPPALLRDGSPLGRLFLRRHRGDHGDHVPDGAPLRARGHRDASA
jgi:integrase